MVAGVSVGDCVSVGAEVEVCEGVTGAVGPGVSSRGISVEVGTTVGREGWVRVAGMDSGGCAGGGRIPRNKNRKSNRRMIATINLKRS